MLSDKTKNDNDDDAAALAIKEAEEAELKKQEEFDKARQRADQEAANAQKARAMLDQATQQLADQQASNESMKSELDELKAKAQSQGVDLKEEDYDGTDLTLVRAIKTLQDKYEAGNKAQAERFKKLEKVKDDLITERAAEKVRQDSNAVYDGLLTDLDEEYGQQCRNAALKEFDELKDTGKVPKNNVAQATRILEKCYKNSKKAIDKAAKDRPANFMDDR